MKNFTTSFLLSLLVAFSLISCSSNSSDDEVIAENSTVDYWPTNIDNTWIFTQDDEDTTMKIISKEEMGGSTYFKFNRMVGVGNSFTGEVSTWIKKNKGDYYIKIGDVSLDFVDFTGTTTGYEFIILKDYLEVNQTWTGNFTHKTTYSMAGIPAIETTINYTGKILEKGTSLNINGTVYKEVIKFSLNQKASSMGQVTQITTYYWAAKNVGLIRIENNGVVSDLKSYSLK